jgi:hypothetical protein
MKYSLIFFFSVSLLSSYEIQGQLPEEKTPGEKLMDFRRLQKINDLWSLFWNRNSEQINPSEQQRVRTLMLKVQFPQVDSENTPTEEVTKIIRASINDLGGELQSEIARIQAESTQPSDLIKPRDNLTYLHLNYALKLEDWTLWLKGDYRTDKAAARYNAAASAASAGNGDK